MIEYNSVTQSIINHSHCDLEKTPKNKSRYYSSGWVEFYKTQFLKSAYCLTRTKNVHNQTQ